MTFQPIPMPTDEDKIKALRAMWQERTLLAGLEVFNRQLGDIFQLPLPGFQTVFLAGPEANRMVLVTEHNRLRWRAEADPVTKLLRHGVLVEDGASHDDLRRIMNPALHRRALESYAEAMIRHTDSIAEKWSLKRPVDMFGEMRKVTLLILIDTLFGADFSPHMERLWNAIIRAIQYISPGLWVVWNRVPRLGYQKALRDLDNYLFQLIALRRADAKSRDDLLGHLIEAGLSDDLIRDQLLTMLIAGHDTSTALLAWALFAISTYPDVQATLRAEVKQVLGGETPAMKHIGMFQYLNQVIDETLRLYPPIHHGSRIAAEEIPFRDYRISAGTRVMYSIYLTHRNPAYWPEPHKFDPSRFESGSPAPYTFLPFGGGSRNCIGAAFARLEAQLVLARLIQKFEFEFVGKRVRPYMRATLEPHPGVPARITRV